MPRVFVYGTLKGGNPTRGLEKFVGTELVGIAKTVQPEWDLVDLGYYPAAVKGTHCILGEVWEVSRDVMVELDIIEGYPTYYNRQKVMTDQGDAWMYYFRENLHEKDIDNHGGVSYNDYDNTVEWNLE